MDRNITTEVLVLGGGPGGYSAAFRAADLGKQVTVVEQEAQLGGVCLHIGCIPSKTLLHAAEVISEAKEIASYGVHYSPPKSDVKQLSQRKDQVVQQLAKGVSSLAEERNVTVIQGKGKFTGEYTLSVETEEGEIELTFSYAVIAVGSRPIELPELPSGDSRVWNSSTALSLQKIPENLLIIGGGIIGMEMAEVYHALGSRVSVAEMADQLIPGADSDLVRPLYTRAKKQLSGIYLGTKAVSADASGDALRVFLEGKKAPEYIDAEAVLVSVGRRANGDLIGAGEAGVELTDSGVIPVDEFLRTNSPHIYAVGDVTGAPMLAHRASSQGKTAAEHISGEAVSYDPMTVPSVAYTIPEIAWMGVTEKEAEERQMEFRKGSIPWQVSGRALSAGKEKGYTKALFHGETGRIIGAGIAGENASELLAEAVLALEMGADAEDIKRTVHAHPTLSETLQLAAEQVLGTITDMLPSS